ncbi:MULTISPECIES: FadR/GntR family transcriptional regulator [Actinoalloteichus]|uniref:Transcriptional regulator n=1 Tax=Actinoalloteichus fjordicus TaxID=1612552 RepID=A0AAC9L7A3_9PSEU|nr:MULTISPECIES: FCD domain-containing protein [Actinoalloteichus]APU12462.1 transcriptional regulator [Actinoalloteichus fjordicus]APU18415.1 transcriptional regulator [Actinoalloteichus sp. GBA129-24]
MAVTDDAIARLREMIQRGELVPGARLPPESELADGLGLSRNSLREAVRALALVHILDVRQGSGTYVASLRAEEMLDSLAFALEMYRDHDSALEVLQVRRILEPEATAMTSARMTPPVLHRLRTLCSSIRPDDPVPDLVRHELDFHHEIARTAGNAYLGSLLAALHSPTVDASLWRRLAQDGKTGETLDEHRLIVDALAAGKAELARYHARTHLTHIEQALRGSAED